MEVKNTMKVAITAKRVVMLMMTMAFAVAMVACQAATPKAKTPVALGGATLSDMSFPDFVAGTDTAAAKRVTITGSHFKGTKLKYTASSSNASVATATPTGSVVTVTPKGAGTATVTVIAAATADDEEGTQSLSFTVTVKAPETATANNPPEIRTVLGNVSLQVDGTSMLTLSHYYVDRDEGDTLTYTADSSDDDVATVTDPDATSMITITAVDEGTATITVTATDGVEGNDPVPQMFTATVTAPVETLPEPPPDNNAPRLKAGKTLPHHTDLLYGGSREVDLSEYFTDDEGDAITYDADSTDEEVVTTSVSGSMLTITVVNHGDATIRVTATDTHNQSIKEAFDVTVINQAPMIEADEPTRFGPYMPGDPPLKITVSEYFTDVEGDSLDYDVASVSPLGSAFVTVTGPDADSIITITAKAVGEAMITITATDGTSVTTHTLTVTVSAVPNEAPEVVGDGIPTQSLQLVVDEATMTESLTKTLDLIGYFVDPDGLPGSMLSYSTESEMATVDGATLTITASVAGTTEITVTASDGPDQASDTFTVMVSSPERPERTGPGLNLQTFSSPSADPKTIELGQYFEREAGYRPSSDNPTAVEATVDGATLTLTPMAAGDADVTVTPFNSGGDGVPLTFRVKVGPEPTTETPAPPTINSDNPIRDQTRVLGDNHLPMDISGHFKGEVTSYVAVSRTPATVRASATDAGILTLTLLKHGTARVMVTARNSGGEVSDDFNVTVQAKPTFKEGKSLDDIRINVVSDGADPPVLTPANRMLPDLSTLFEDPDGAAALTYSTKTNDAKKVRVTKAAITAAPTNDSAVMAEGESVKLWGIAAGKATITVTVTDGDGLSTEAPFEVMVVVGVNVGPVTADGTITAISAANRLKLGPPTKVIDNKDIKDYFMDDDLVKVPDGDLLTFTVMYVPTDDALDGEVETVTDPVATATVVPDMWNGDAGGVDQFTVTVTPKKVGGPHDILIIATDRAGARIFQRIPVQVNHNPLTYGPEDDTMEDDRMTLAEHASKNLVDLPIEGTDPEIDLDNFFSDADDDSDTLEYHYFTSEDSKKADDRIVDVTVKTGSINRNEILEVKTQHRGRMTVTAWAEDSVGAKSDRVTFEIHVGRRASIAPF